MTNETGCVVTGDHDLKLLERLTDGIHSRVEKVERTVNNHTVIAKKTFLNYYPEQATRSPIAQQLNAMREYNSSHLVLIYGAFIERACVSVCMEYMDRGSFEDIYKQTGPINIDILGKVALAVLEGIVYLHDIHHILHEDVKPSNILVNSKGEIKLTDFVTARIAEIDKTFIGSGTSVYYLSPEIVRAAQYTPRTLKSEVWALGISLVELALGRHPYSEADEPLTILDVLTRIVNGPPPRLSTTNAGGYPAEVENFVDNCLMVDVERRNTPDELLRHPWMEKSRLSIVDVGLWASTVTKVL
ncbi:kinase-like domain-containing protein [Panaeolus papilionaceus]|nr:kinase-like domain-containing protein [Panaeolus papilionaceus]